MWGIIKKRMDNIEKERFFKEIILKEFITAWQETIAKWSYRSGEQKNFVENLEVLLK
tara:strand:+ start:162 stop:332 length:171 start_codon:yes stop_codon:yes gene_type:complete